MTTLVPFEPLGEKSRREIVLAELADSAYGELVEYDRLSELLGGVDRNTVQVAVGVAKAALEREHHKAVVAVPNTGYRIVQPGEHLGLAVHHQRKSRRSLVRSLSKVTHVDASQLSEGEAAAITVAAVALAAQIDYARRNDLRAARHEKAIKAVTSASDRSAEEIAELRARLDRLEGTQQA